MALTIASALITMVIIPVLAPTLSNLFACMWIGVVNKTKDKPTWKVRTKFEQIILPNGAYLGRCYIYKVTWSCFILKSLTGEGSIRLKKSKMLRCTHIESAMILG
jgi:hypothetical protein